MTVGVIGTGHIGQAVVKRLRGFGCHVLAYDNSRKMDADYVQLDELLKTAILLRSMCRFVRIPAI